VDMWTTLRLAHIPTGEQNQKKRTYDVLPKPDNFIRYRHMRGIRLRRFFEPEFFAAAEVNWSLALRARFARAQS